jgi:hypothetical protein
MTNKINENISKDNTNIENNDSNTYIRNINDFFKLPIYYNNDRCILNKNIIEDLELIESAEPSCNSIYDYYFNVNNQFASQTSKQAANFFTKDVAFLKDNQKLISTYKKNQEKYTNYSNNYEMIVDVWNKIKLETSFKEKYYYVDWPIFEFLNKSSSFLQIMSIYNLASPIISLLIPILILIIPFFVIKMKGIKLTVDEYIQILKILINQNAIGRLFTKFNDVSMQEKIYLLVSAGFYLFSFYQNILICMRFNNNMIEIHKYLFEIRTYLNYTIANIDNYLKYSKDLETHAEFNNILIKKRLVISELYNKMNRISNYELKFRKMSEIGDILKYFYEIYSDDSYNDAIMYSFGFNGYLDCIEGLQNNIEERKLSFATFTNKKRKTKFVNSYYAVLKDSEHVKNTVSLKKNLIITGPNASGKTTILKSTLINIICSQQFGCGFYENAEMKPFDFVHCYLNIPDTSGRDSLFQAEARRCKDIIDIIDNNKDSEHFCMFDELYSGTNPDEAVTSSTAFMKYIIKNKNVTCMLTTHFVKVCKKLNKTKNILNCHMQTNKQNNKINYTYHLMNGISEIKGGINVLCDMNYPKEIIDNTIKYA